MIIKVMITLDNPKFRQLRTNGICQLEIRRARQGLNNLFSLSLCDKKVNVMHVCTHL